MAITCNCDHLRNVHIGGNEYDSDRRVLGCHVEGCTCKHFSADRETRSIKQDIMLGCLVLPLIIVVFSVVAFVGLGYFIDGILTQFTITEQTATKLVYLNGTDVPKTDIVTPADTIKTSILMVVGLGLFVLNYFIVIFYTSTQFDAKYRKLYQK